MADTPKHPPMTFREAVEIVIQSEVSDVCGDYSPAFDNTTRSRARAIVDAAVEFVEAREQEWDGHTPLPGAIRKFHKLRALERGEEIQ